MLGNLRFNYFQSEDTLITKILEIKMMLLLGLALIFLVWLVFTAFTLEDPALTMHQDENWYEDEDEDEDDANEKKE